MKIIICTSKVTYACLLHLDSMASRSHHGSILCQNPKTKQTVTKLLRLMHIKPSPNKTNHTDMPHGLLQEKPRSLASTECRMHLYVLLLFQPTSPSIAMDFIGSDPPLVTRVALTALQPIDLQIYKIWRSSGVACAFMR